MFSCNLLIHTAIQGRQKTAKGADSDSEAFIEGKSKKIRDRWKNHLK